MGDGTAGSGMESVEIRRVLPHALLDGAKGACEATAPQFVDPGLREVLIAIPQIFRHRDVLDRRIAPERREDRPRQVGKGAGPTRPGVIEPVRRLCRDLSLEQVQRGRHGVFDVDEIAPLPAVGIAFPKGLEERHPTGLPDLVIRVKDDRGHPAFVGLPRPVHVEVFPPRPPGRRVDLLERPQVEPVLRLAVQVEGLQRPGIGLVIVSLRAVPVRGGARSVNEGDARPRTPLPQHPRVLRVHGHDVVAVPHGGGAAGPLVNHRLDRDPRLFQPLPQIVPVHVRIDRELVKGAPVSGDLAEGIDPDDIRSPAGIQRGDHVRPDEAGGAGHDDHGPRLLLQKPGTATVPGPPFFGVNVYWRTVMLRTSGASAPASGRYRTYTRCPASSASTVARPGPRTEVKGARRNNRVSASGAGATATRPCSRSIRTIRPRSSPTRPAAAGAPAQAADMQLSTTKTVSRLHPTPTPMIPRRPRLWGVYDPGIIASC